MREHAKVLFGSILLLVALAGQSSAQSRPTASLEFIAAERLLELQRSGQPPLVVDVRTAKEFEAEHIRGAVNIPLRQLEWRYREIPQKGLVVLY